MPESVRDTAIFLEVPLRVEQFRVRQALAEHILHTMPMVAHSLIATSWMDEALHALVVQLTADVARAEGQRRSLQTRQLRWPATWHDHLKEWFAAHCWWARRWPVRQVLRRWPIRYHTEHIATEIVEYRLCPHVTEKWDTRRDVHLYWLMERNSESFHA